MKEMIFYFQGFYRYFIDVVWYVFYFEKMLYDQGQFLFSYVEVYQVSLDIQYINYCKLCIYNFD